MSTANCRGLCRRGRFAYIVVRTVRARCPPNAEDWRDAAALSRERDTREEPSAPVFPNLADAL